MSGSAGPGGSRPLDRRSSRPPRTSSKSSHATYGTRSARQSDASRSLANTRSEYRAPNRSDSPSPTNATVPCRSRNRRASSILHVPHPAHTGWPFGCESEGRPSVNAIVFETTSRWPTPARLEHRFDVEGEPVAHHGEGQAHGLRPPHEGREGGIDRVSAEGVREHVVTGGRQHRRLPPDRGPQAHPAPLDLGVEVAPGRIAERVEQRLRDVLRTGRPVEVHEDGADGRHGVSGYRRDGPAPGRAQSSGTGAGGSARADDREGLSPNASSTPTPTAAAPAAARKLPG